MNRDIKNLIRKIIAEQAAQSQGVVLQYGSRGNEVKQLQSQLNKCNSQFALKEDGIFGLKTLVALLKQNKGQSETINTTQIPTLCQGQAKPTAQYTGYSVVKLQTGRDRNRFNLSTPPNEAFVEKNVIYLNTFAGLGQWMYSTTCKYLEKNQIWNMTTKKYETCNDELKNKLITSFCQK